MDLIRIHKAVKSHAPRFRLGPIDLRLEAGEVLGIMGPNGAGKTTLLRMIWGFLRPDAGSVSVFQVAPHLNQVSVRLRAGYLSESPHFYDWMTVARHLKFVSEFYEGWDDAYVSGLLERFEIDPSLRMRQLSRGTRTKVGLIAAAGHNPFLLLLDEPTAGLDPIVRREIVSFLCSVAKERGAGIILSSHISDDLDQLADTVLMLHQGRPIENAPASILRQKYGMSRLEDIFVEAVQDTRSNLR